SLGEGRRGSVVAGHDAVAAVHESPGSGGGLALTPIAPIPPATPWWVVLLYERPGAQVLALVLASVVFMVVFKYRKRTWQAVAAGGCMLAAVGFYALAYATE